MTFLHESKSKKIPEKTGIGNYTDLNMITQQKCGENRNFIAFFADSEGSKGTRLPQ